MNKHLLFMLIIPLFLMVSTSQGQGLKYGLKGGFNLGTPYGKPEDGATGSPGLGPAVGVYIIHRLSLKWRVQAEFLYSKKSSTFKPLFPEIQFGRILKQIRDIPITGLQFIGDG